MFIGYNNFILGNGEEIALQIDGIYLWELWDRSTEIIEIVNYCVIVDGIVSLVFIELDILYTWTS